MNRTELHPVEALLVAVIVVFDAAVVLAVSLVALLLTVAGWRPTPRKAAPPAPLVHPIALLAGTAVDALQPQTVAQLRRHARSAGLPRALSRNGRRDALLQALAGLEVAACS